MAKGEKRKAEKVKRVRLMKRHRDAILAAFGRAVDERFNAAARECFTGLVTDAMRKVFSGDELRAFNAAPEELAARLADTECCIYPQNEKTWDQVTVKVTPMKARKGCRIPYRFAVPRAVVDKADAHKRRLEQERDEAKVLAFRIVAACRTTADLREMWPDGERFWGPMAERLELEAGTSTCVGLVPAALDEHLPDALIAGRFRPLRPVTSAHLLHHLSQMERLNDVSRKLREV